MQQHKILIVEDDKNIREYLEDAFKEERFIVKSTGDGADAINLIKKESFDLIILDLGLESVSGETVCAEAKKIHPRLPIIVLTAKNTTPDIVHGLEMGADDYVPKPFVTEELIARAKSKLSHGASPILQVEDLTLNTETMEVMRGDRKITLTAKEFKLLEYMMLNRGMVLSREAILDHIWLYSPDIETRVVDVYVGYLRKKIDNDNPKKLINSVRGFGYKIQ